MGECNVFTPVCHSVHRMGCGIGAWYRGEGGGIEGGGGVSAQMMECLPRGVSAQGVSAQGMSAHTQVNRHPPPPRWSLLRSVRILLECILV